MKEPYRLTCPFPTRPVREFVARTDTPTSVSVRDNFNGEWSVHEFLKRQSVARGNNLNERRLSAIEFAYVNALPLKKAKYDDLQTLAKFCSNSAMAYFKSLPFVSAANAIVEADTDSEDESVDE